MIGVPEAARSRRRLPFPGPLSLAAFLALQAPLQGQDRLFRRYAASQGLQATLGGALAQDERGFLWIGGHDGLFRYDGTEFRRWATGELDGAVRAIATTAPGRLVALIDDGSLFEVVGDSARPLAAPLPPGLGEHNAVAFDGRGGLWIVRGGRVARLEGKRGWRTLPAEAFGGEEPRFLRPAPDGEMMGVATQRGVWRVDHTYRPTKLLNATWPADFAFLPNGGIAALDSAIHVARGGSAQRLDPFRAAEIRPRPIALAHRGGTLWAAYDRYLVAVRPDRPPEILGPDRGVESGGPLLVDHEGSLWMATFTALLQYPEPETRIWNERSALRSQHTRFIGRSGEALWVTTWQGTALIRREEARARWLDEWSQKEVCEDPGGAVWLAVSGAVIRARGERVVARHPVDSRGPLSCAPDPAGGTWLVLADRLFHADSGGLRTVVVPPFPAAARPVTAMLHDSRSGLWIGGDALACRGEVAGRDTIRGWECSSLPRAGLVLAFVETGRGDIWAAASRAGVLRHQGEGWTEAPGNELLPSRSLLNLIPSPAGGVWVLGDGVAWRVEEAEDDRAPWHVRERLGEWHGLPHEGGRDLEEDPDGTLWITTSLGVIEVPAAARGAEERPPPVAFDDALIDEERIGATGRLELPHDRNRLELRFAVLSFRDPGRLRYQVRLSPGDPWREATGRPWFRWIDLPARPHTAQLRASLDGRRWTETPASFAFRVRPPWYRTFWAVALFAGGTGLLLWLGYRARVRYLLGLERERMRIAMDLHDEMGSGLGSIGILSGLLSSRGLEDGKGRDLARRIARIAEDLGGSLSDIIWSLDARPATLGELASRLADSGMTLLGAQGVAFRTDFPETWPPDRLSARQRRNLLLIGLEALHNAARHSDATRVTVMIRGGGKRWEMRIADDGVGFDPASGGGGGHGLGTMHRRTEEIGASIEWRARPGHGTAVVLRFSLATSHARRRPDAAWGAEGGSQPGSPAGAFSTRRSRVARPSAPRPRDGSGGGTA